MIYAHRGWHSAPALENGLDAFKRAADAGFGIETDLRTDVHGRLLLFHDRVVGDRAVEAMSRLELEERIGRTVPTLEDLINAELAVPINLEVKTKAAWRALVPLVGSAIPFDVLVSSFIHDLTIEAAVAHALPAARLMASAPAEGELAGLAAAPVRTIVWDHNVVDRQLLTDARRHGLRSIVYGALTFKEHLMLAEADCDVITDTPDVAQAARAAAGRDAA